MTASQPGERRTDVLVVTHYFPSHGGGIEAVAGRLVDGYVSRGHRVEWLASATDTPPDGTALLKTHPIAAFNFIERWTHLPYPIWSPSGLVELWRGVGRAQAVQVHEHLYVGSLAAIVFARLRRRRIVLTQHMGALRLGSRSLTRLYEVGTRMLACVVMRLVTHVVFVSANVAAFFANSARANGCVVFNGLDVGIFHPADARQRAEIKSTFGLSGNAPVAIFAGRYVHKKGLALLREIASATSDIQWLFAGSGPLDPASWGLPNVRDLGQLSQVELARAFAAADILVLPSRGEGFPLVVQEALACGTAVLSTGEVQIACPSASDMISALDVLDDPEDVHRWADRLRSVLALETSQPARIERALRAARTWSWEACATAHLALLEPKSP